MRSFIKYEDLITEIQGMWNVKAKVLPVITGATGTIPKLLRHYLSNIARKHEIKEVQNKTVIFGSTHALREVLV